MSKNKEFLMKNKKTLLAVLAVALVFGITACKEEGGGGNNVTVSGDIIGTWKINGSTYTATVTNTTYETYNDYGTFSSWNGKTAGIYSSVLKKNVGTITVTSSTTATTVLNKNAELPPPGTYYWTKIN